MIVTVASGKGGTGKTLVATGLAAVLAREEGADVHLVDCDVEEPNAHLFLEPRFDHSEEVTIPVPRVDLDLCDFCGRCAKVCAFHALAVLPDRVMIFPEMCHGCGSCTLQCPQGAISEEPKTLGRIEWGRAGGLSFAQGVLEVGQALATPLIRRLKARVIPDDPGATVILDAPPGNACSAVETVKGSHFALLVTEPTPFGLHDLKLAVELARDALGLPVGVVINRDGLGDAGVEDYCAAVGVPVLARLPYDRRIAEAYSDGRLWVEALPEYQGLVLDIARSIRERVGVKP